MLSNRRCRQGLLGLVVLWLSTAGSWVVLAGVSRADDPAAPIEGTWNLTDGQVVVQAQPDGSLIGTVTVPSTFGSCTHPVGQQIWQIHGSGTSYTGTHIWYHADCEPNPGGAATWTIVNTDPTTYTMTFCTAPPGSGPPNASATPGNPVGSTQCFSLIRKLSASQTPPAPQVLSGPRIVGTAKAGDTLTCSPGTYANNPTVFKYLWARDGTPIAGATSGTYRVKVGDEGLGLRCTVTPVGAGGAGQPQTGPAVQVPIPFVKGCPAVTGQVTGKTLGAVTLGMDRTSARHALRHSKVRKLRYRDLFCMTPYGVQAGYGFTKVLGPLSARQQSKTTGRVVLLLTTNALYTVNGIRVGATLTAAQGALKLTRALKGTVNTWYTAPLRKSTALLEVHGGLVSAIGIADSRLTKTGKARQRLIKAY
jgi:hypothetical protein